MANVCVNTSLMGQISERPVAKTIRQNPRERRQIKKFKKKNTNHKHSCLKRRVLFGQYFHLIPLREVAVLLSSFGVDAFHDTKSE